MVYTSFVLGAETSGQVRKIYKFIMTYFGQFLNDLNKMTVLNVQSSAMTDHNEGGAKLLDLIDEKIFEYM